MTWLSYFYFFQVSRIGVTPSPLHSGMERLSKGTQISRFSYVFILSTILIFGECGIDFNPYLQISEAEV